MTYDEALERFNEEMSNACCASDRKQATKQLAKIIGDAAKAERLRRDWMDQYRATNQEMRA